MPPNNNRNPSHGGAKRKGPQSHPYIWLFLMGGLGVGLPLLFYGLLAFIAQIGGWRWEFLGHPDGLSCVLLALMIPPPFVSLLLWWFLLVTRAQQPTFRRGLLAGVCGAVFAFPLEGFWMGGVLLVLANPGGKISAASFVGAAVLGALLGLLVPIFSWVAWLWIGGMGLLGGLLGVLAGRRDFPLPRVLDDYGNDFTG